MRALILGVLMLILLGITIESALAYNHFNTCAISTGSGLLHDVDCDGVPDSQDRCPETAGMNQGCPRASQTQPDAQSAQQQAQSSDARLRQAGTQTEPADFSVNAVQTQDIFIDGPGAVYQVKITNNGRSAREVQLDVSGADFGSVTIDPSSMLTISPGETRTAYVHAVAIGASEGQKSFTLAITSGRDYSREIQMTANILKITQEDAIGENSDTAMTIISWVLLIAVVLLLAYIAHKYRKKEDKDFQSYY